MKKINRKNDLQIKSKERVKNLAEVFTNQREVNAMLDLIEEEHFIKKTSISTFNINTTYLEPACGNGNFLINILNRKLNTIFKKYENKKLNKKYIKLIMKDIFIALSTIYAIDISIENINETKKRLKELIFNRIDIENIMNLKKLGKFNQDNYISTSFFSLLENKSNFIIYQNYHNNLLSFFNSIDYVLNKNIILGDSLNKQDEIYFSQFNFLKNGSHFFIEKIYNYKELEKDEKVQIPFKILKEKNFLKIS